MRGLKYAVAYAAFAAVVGCSEDQREEAIGRTTRAAQALNGNATSDSVQHDIPNIVEKQRKLENIRQNTQWTKENQALHPIEYCQSQLVELDRMSKQLQVQVHSIATAKAATQRKSEDAKSQIESYGRLIKEAKAAYRAAEASNQWPMQLNGFQLSKDRAEQKIVDMAQRLATMRSLVAKSVNQIAAFEKKAVKLENEQRKVIKVRERVQVTLEELKTKQVIDGANGIADALNAINDSMSSLGVDADDPSIDDLAIPDSSAERTKLFKEIMAEE